jgi:hypothetical protein
MWQLWAEFVNFCDEPLFDMIGPIDDELCVALKPGQPLQALIRIGRVGSGAGRDRILRRWQIPVTGAVITLICTQVSSP